MRRLLSLQCYARSNYLKVLMSEEADPVNTNTKQIRLMNQLEALKEMTVVVADTGDYAKIKHFTPKDATTNPSLILQAAQLPEYAQLVSGVVAACKNSGLSSSEERLTDQICERLAVQFGVEILKLIPGRVSTEVDACYSFDAKKLIEKAHRLLALYKENGVSGERVLIKLASTWEGIEACRVLEAQGIHCNMTLIFNYHQAIACAQAGASLISPFVGRILDWFVKNQPSETPYTKLTDPGVVSVSRIYRYFKTHGHTTTVMGASFRSKDQILGLAGIDSLTVAPKLLDELEKCTDPLERILGPDSTHYPVKVPAEEKVTESSFRWAMNEDQMATEKLSEGIRNFNKDLEKLRAFVKTKI